MLYIGRAPWGYHFVQIARNLSFDADGNPISPPETGCVLSSEECTKHHSIHGTISLLYCPEAGFWKSDNGHILAWTKPKIGESFFPCNSPAHIQGTL